MKCFDAATESSGYTHTHRLRHTSNVTLSVYLRILFVHGKRDSRRERKRLAERERGWEWERQSEKEQTYRKIDEQDIQTERGRVKQTDREKDRQVKWGKHLERDWEKRGGDRQTEKCMERGLCRDRVMEQRGRNMHICTSHTFSSLFFSLSLSLFQSLSFSLNISRSLFFSLLLTFSVSLPLSHLSFPHRWILSGVFDGTAIILSQYWVLSEN